MRHILPRLALAAALAGGSIAFASAPVDTILFGSCLRQDRPQPVWDVMRAMDPDLVLLLGDNVYADTEDMDVMRRAYEELGRQPGFARLRAEVSVMATWDDHDYGVNDAGAEYPRKAEAEEIFLDFYGVAPDSPVRTRPGIYSDRVFGPPGRRVQVILLDTRYFRGPTLWSEGDDTCPGGRYVGNQDPAASMLGDDQWRWLAERLREPAELRIIASSIQVLPDQQCWEKWANLPLERERLFDLIRDTRAGGVVLISGDRHIGEISRVDGALDYPLIEVTSSGLNTGGGGPEANRYRTSADNVRRDNFGVIRVDWSGSQPTVRLEVRDLNGTVALEEVLPLAQLQPVAGERVADASARSLRAGDAAR